MAPSQVIIKHRSRQLSKSGNEEGVGRAAHSQLRAQEKTGAHGSLSGSAVAFRVTSRVQKRLLFCVFKNKTKQKNTGVSVYETELIRRGDFRDTMLSTVKQSSDHCSRPPITIPAMPQGLTHSQDLNTSPTDLPSHQMAWIPSHLTISWARTVGQVTNPLWARHPSLFGTLLTVVFKVPALFIPKFCPALHSPPVPRAFLVVHRSLVLWIL